MLLSCLQITLSSEILSHDLGRTLAQQLWDRLFNYFHKQTRVRACHIRVELRAVTLENSSFQDYLLQIRKTVDALASIIDHIPSNHHDVILEGLSFDYAPTFYVTKNKFGMIDLDEVEVLLLAHELRLTKFKKQLVVDMASINLTHTTPPQTSSSNEDTLHLTTEPVPITNLEQAYNSFCGGQSNLGG